MSASKIKSLDVYLIFVELLALIVAVISYGMSTIVVVPSVRTATEFSMCDSPEVTDTELTGIWYLVKRFDVLAEGFLVPKSSYDVHDLR